MTGEVSNQGFYVSKLAKYLWLVKDNDTIQRKQNNFTLLMKEYTLYMERLTMTFGNVDEKFVYVG